MYEIGTQLNSLDGITTQWKDVLCLNLSLGSTLGAQPMRHSEVNEGVNLFRRQILEKVSHLHIMEYKQ